MKRQDLNAAEELSLPTQQELKLSLEIEKLQAEIVSIKKPIRAQPQLWLTAAALVSTIVVQFYFADQQKEHAKLEKMKLEVDTSHLELKQQKLERDLTATSVALAAAKIQNRQETQLLEKLRRDIASDKVAKDDLARQVEVIQGFVEKSPVLTSLVAAGLFKRDASQHGPSSGLDSGISTGSTTK
jgi:hypothetical protein